MSAVQSNVQKKFLSNLNQRRKRDKNRKTPREKKTSSIVVECTDEREKTRKDKEKGR